MPRVFLSTAAFEDLLRLEEFLSDADDPLVGELLDYVLDALQVLTHQPCIGRPVAGGLRELIVSRRRSGYWHAMSLTSPVIWFSWHVSGTSANKGISRTQFERRCVQPHSADLLADFVRVVEL